MGGYCCDDRVAGGVGVCECAVASDPLVDVSAVEVLVDVGPGLGQSGVPMLVEGVGAEGGGVFACWEGHRGGGDCGLVGLVHDPLLGGLSGVVTVEPGG